MKALIIVASLLASSSAVAGWSTGDCVTQSGTKLRYMISSGSGYIFYNGDGPYEVYSELKDNLGVINHIGNKGNMRMAVDLRSGRGYLVTRHDNGRVVEGNIVCTFGYKE